MILGPVRHGVPVRTNTLKNSDVQVRLASASEDAGIRVMWFNLKFHESKVDEHASERVKNEQFPWFIPPAAAFSLQLVSSAARAVTVV
jgi:hypothetical protein